MIDYILETHPQLLILDEPTNGLDPIGIISNGALGYEAQIHPYEDLESLFMEVVEKNRNGGD